MATMQKMKVLSEEENSDNELSTTLIDLYTSLQRIKAATDRDKEIDYQISIVKAKLALFNANTSDLDII